MNHLRCAVTTLVLLASINLVGCTSFAVRSTPANLSELSGLSDEQRDRMTDADVAAMMDRKPLVKFPASIAVVQVQGSASNPYYGSHHRHGSPFHVVFNREAETDEQLNKVNGLSRVRGVTSLSRLVLHGQPKTDRDLRAAAARLNTDLLLVYTFDTQVYQGNNTSPLDVITLGFLPHRHMRVQSTASALLMDTRNGYIYATSEGAATTKQLANTWTNSDAVDQSRRRAERQALEKMVSRFVAGWPQVLAQHDPPLPGATLYSTP